MNFQVWFSQKFPGISIQSATSVLTLAKEGSTVPFIARYRKEQTGNLDEVAIQTVIDANETWETMLKRKEFIVGEIEHQKKLTPELKSRIENTFDPDILEDLYLPYKQKRKTKATLAKEAGLEPLAHLVWQSGHGENTWPADQTLDQVALAYVQGDGAAKDLASVLTGTQDILIERISEEVALRQKVRETVFKHGFVRSKKAEAQPASKYERYFDFQEAVPTLLDPANSHRYLAMKRGWMEKELVVSIGPRLDENTEKKSETGYEENLLRDFQAFACTQPDSPGAKLLLMAARLSFKVYVLPAIDTEVHRELKNIADIAAIKVFSENVRKLLLSPPFGPKSVLGIDPGIRTGCKLVVISKAGKYIDNAVVYMQTEAERRQAKEKILKAIDKAKIESIAIGNGTASRETETFVRLLVKEAGLNIPVVVVSESGASVYSASDTAREEFPELDVTVRGAISIARRFQDPLAELVKVDPKSIGVGQYQHDVNQITLKKSLDAVVDSCVNTVGVNVNTASYHLLSHVSGIGPGLAKAIVEYRSQKQLFETREELLAVPRFTQKVFEQAAGFLRVPGGENPLDNTGVHPERYPLLTGLAEKLNKKVEDLLGAGVTFVKNSSDFKKQVGEFTFADIVAELEKPGRDPRATFEAVSFRDDIHDIPDLKADMICPGVVTNVTNFGAFVDIGVHQDGLVHISQLSDHFVKDPRDVVNAGDRVTVRVLSIDLAKKQIALTMKSPEAARRSANEQGTPRGKMSDSSSKKSTSTFQKPPPKAQQPFNNPFAALANKFK